MVDITDLYKKNPYSCSANTFSLDFSEVDKTPLCENIYTVNALAYHFLAHVYLSITFKFESQSNVCYQLFFSSNRTVKILSLF